MHGHLQGASGADGHVQRRQGAVGSLEVAGSRAADATSGERNARVPLCRTRDGWTSRCCAWARTATTSRSAAAARSSGCSRRFRHAHVRWVVLGAAGPRGAEAVASADKFLANARTKEVVVKEFRDGFFPLCRRARSRSSSRSSSTVCAPDLILTHYRNDLHQDHRVVSELTWNTFRDHLILEYEIVKYDGDLGAPNFFVQLNDATCRQKVRAPDGVLRKPEEQAAGSPRIRSSRCSGSVGSNAMPRSVMPRRSIVARCRY